MPDPSFIIPLFLQSALLPFALALMVLLLTREANLADGGTLAAVAAAFLASYFAVYHAQWSFLPQQSLDWLPWIVLLGGAGVIVAEKTAHPLPRHAMRLALCIGSVTLLVWPAVASGGLQRPLLSIAVAGLLMFAAWTYLGAAATQRPTPAFMLVVVAGGAALALMLDSSQVIGQLSGALATTIIAALVFNRHNCNDLRSCSTKNHFEICFNCSARIAEVPMHRGILVSFLKHNPHANTLGTGELLQPQSNQHLIHRVKKIPLHSQEVGTKRTQILVPVITDKPKHSINDFFRSCIRTQRAEVPLCFILPDLALTLLCLCCNICPCHLERVSGESSAPPGVAAAEPRMCI